MDATAKLAEQVANRKTAPYKNLEDLLERHGDAVIALVHHSERVTLSQLLISLPDLSLGEILHVVWLLKQDQKVDFSHHIEEMDSLLDRVSVVPFQE